MAGDVADTETAGEALDGRPRGWAGLWGLVNNAGINPYYHPVIETPLSEWDEVLRVNLLGAAAFARAVGRALVEAGGGGRIVNLSSIAGLTGLPNIGPYNASKAALDALTRTLAVELGPAGILCNSVAPGTIATEMVEGLMTANPALQRAPGGQVAARAHRHRRRGGLADRLPAHRRRQLHHRPDAGGRRRTAGRRLGGPCGSSSAGPAPPGASPPPASRRTPPTR